MNDEPLLVSRGEAGRLLGVHLHTIDRMIKRGALESRKIGARTLIQVESIRRVAGHGAPMRSAAKG